MTDPYIDFAASWRAYLLAHDRSGRLDPTTDLDFWRGYAPYYDLRTSAEGSYAETLAFLSQLVNANDTLLEVGAGTGRFALPLATRVRWVTALDYSAEMLAILRQKAEAEQITNLSILEAPMEEALLSPHDVVLAAWSLYRQLDLVRILQRLMAAAKRLLIIVAGDTWDPPHRPLFEEIWGPANEPGLPAYLYILGALRQIDAHADLHIVWERRRYIDTSPHHIASKLAPLDATPDAIARFAEKLTPLLAQDGDAWRYDIRFAVGIVVLPTHPICAPSKGAAPQSQERRLYPGGSNHRSGETHDHRSH